MEFTWKQLSTLKAVRVDNNSILFDFSKTNLSVLPTTDGRSDGEVPKVLFPYHMFCPYHVGLKGGFVYVTIPDQNASLGLFVRGIMSKEYKSFTDQVAKMRPQPIPFSAAEKILFKDSQELLVSLFCIRLGQDSFFVRHGSPPFALLVENSVGQQHTGKTLG